MEASIKTFGDYTIDRILGEGAFAKVYLVRRDSELCALKLVLKSAKPEVEILRNGISFHKRLNEVDAPLIVRFFGIIEDDLHLGILMEYISGRELIDFVLKNRININDSTLGLPMNMVKAIMSQLINTIISIHKLNISHGDLKLENVMIPCEDPLTIKLIDFGLATNCDAAPFRGSEPYLSPETVMGKPNRRGDKCDIWALGVMMFAISTGRFPFDPKPGFRSSNEYRAMLRRIAVGQYKYSEVEQSFVGTNAMEVIAKLMAREPENRNLEDSLILEYIGK